MNGDKMDFSKALEALKAEQKVRRQGMLTLSMAGGRILVQVGIQWQSNGSFREEDILADDWEIVEDIPEVKIERNFTFFCPNCRTHRVLQQLKILNFEKDAVTCGNCGTKVKLTNSDYGVFDSEFYLKLPSLNIDTKLKPGEVYIRNDVSPLKSEIYFGKINIDEEETEASEKGTLSEYKTWLQHIIEISDQDLLTYAGEMNFVKAGKYEIRRGVFEECLGALNEIGVLK